MRTLPQRISQPLVRLRMITTTALLFSAATMFGGTAAEGSTTPAAVAISGRLTCKPGTLNFGSVTLRHAKSMTVTITNTGSSRLTVTKKINAAHGFFWSNLKVPLTLNAGRSVQFYAHFHPPRSGPASGHIYLISNASNPKLTIALSGMGAGGNSLAPNPSNIGFGSVQIGKSVTRYESLTNSGPSSITVSSATISGSGFSRAGLSLPLTLAAGHSVTFSVTFTPKTGGTASGSVSVNSSASNSALKVKLSGLGTGSGQLIVSPATMNFGSVVVGSSKSQTGTLSARDTSVTVSADRLTSSEFTLSGLTFPFTLAVDKRASFTLTFKPQTSGVATASLSLTSDASNSPAVESLSGSGTSAQQHSVGLSWNASTSHVAGYHVYRGNQSGGPYTKINSMLDTSTSYTDSSVQGGQTYYYVVTSVGTSGNQSRYSNQVKAMVPSS
jgi:Abnormal spindle-like microcephaly-assoc'd, ASPM-SPD-2-Hydin